MLMEEPVSDGLAKSADPEDLEKRVEVLETMMTLMKAIEKSKDLKARISSGNSRRDEFTERAEMLHKMEKRQLGGDESMLMKEEPEIDGGPSQSSQLILKVWRKGRKLWVNMMACLIFQIEQFAQRIYFVKIRFNNF